MPESHVSSADQTLSGDGHWAPGLTVAVRNRFTGGWASGFRIVEACSAAHDAYRVRRLSDDAVLPAAFPAEDLRPA